MTAVRDTAGRDYRGRWYVCEGCGRECVAPTRVGRLPKRCEECLPANLRSHRTRARRAQVRTDALAAELARVKAQLAAAQGARSRAVARELDAPVFDEVETRARVLGPPGVDACKRGLIRLRHAQGALDTAERADDLAAALTVWARALRGVPTDVERAGGGASADALAKRRRRAA